MIIRLIFRKLRVLWTVASRFGLVELIVWLLRPESYYLVWQRMAVSNFDFFSSRTDGSVGNSSNQDDEEEEEGDGDDDAREARLAKQKVSSRA